MQQPQKSRVIGVAGARNISFGDGIAAARSIISDGRQALADPELSDPEAVHEGRKAFKRWRAPPALACAPARRAGSAMNYRCSLAIVGPQAGQQYSTDNHLLAARY
jgi:hypothetical protein